MKSFIKKILIFFLVISAILSVDLVLPLNYTSYRPWESLIFFNSKLSLDRPFYPNKVIDMVAVGDLCHHTEFEIKRHEKWITDQLGFRNNIFIPDPDVLLIGDSFTLSSGLTQDSTISNVLSRKFEGRFKVYNMAPSSFSTFLKLYKNNIIKKPKVLIYSFVERSLKTGVTTGLNEPEEMGVVEKAVRSKKSISDNLFVDLDRGSRLYLLRYIKARITKSNGIGVKGKGSSRMFFKNGDKIDQDVNLIVTGVLKLKKRCDELGIQLLFIPIPEKETVYSDEIGLKNGAVFLNNLSEILTNKGVDFLDAERIFSLFRSNFPDTLIYQLDDTHWNSKGVDIITDSIFATFKRKAWLE